MKIYHNKDENVHRYAERGKKSDIGLKKERERNNMTVPNNQQSSRNNMTQNHHLLYHHIKEYDL